MTCSRLLWSVVLAALLLAPMSALATVAPETGEDSAGPAPAAESPIADATDEARRLRRELRALARAWDEGGGRFGYPFWEKAGQRWRDGQLTTAMYREYVTGYRDRLRAGCDLLDAVEVETEPARDVRELAIDSCRTRVDALREQQRWLDDLIRRDTADTQSDEDDASLEERILERETAWRAQLQESLRDARLATDRSQAELDEVGLERISEAAFL